jgi:hypothetical protein
VNTWFIIGVFLLGAATGALVTLIAYNGLKHRMDGTTTTELCTRAEDRDRLRSAGSGRVA